MTSASLVRRDTCRICDGRTLDRVLSFGCTPLANAFLRREELGGSEDTFPLELHLCADCGHLQLLDVVDPERLFRDYLYVSSTSPAFVEHFRRYADDVLARSAPPPGSLVVEIGSNDGVLLRHFQARGMKVLGVDPALAIARAATASGIETLPRFFDAAVAEEILGRHGPAAVVAANNVLAHADDLHGILRGVERLLGPQGVLVFEVSYLLDVYEKTLFDMTYHEHLSYHSVAPLVRLLEAHGLELVEALRVPTHGGSLRALAQRRGGPLARGASVGDLIARERAAGLDRAATFVGFGERIADLKRELRSLLLGLRAEGRRIAGYGAPAKLTTLMHVFEIGPEIVEFVVDDSPLKQHRYTPGHHIPVLPVSELYRAKPDFVLILAWNFAESIIANHRAFQEQGGRFIVPLPRLEVR